MTDRQDALYRFLADYAAFVEEAAAQEEEKYKALISYDAHQVDSIISSQQAVLMRLDGLEKQRERIQEEAGLGGLAFREILGKLEPSDRESFEAIFHKISAAVSSIRFLNQKSMNFAKENLKAIGGMIPAETSGIGQSYAPGRRNTASAPSPLFEKKI